MQGKYLVILSLVLFCGCQQRMFGVDEASLLHPITIKNLDNGETVAAKKTRN